MSDSESDQFSSEEEQVKKQQTPQGDIQFASIRAPLTAEEAANQLDNILESILDTEFEMFEAVASAMFDTKRLELNVARQKREVEVAAVKQISGFEKPQIRKRAGIIKRSFHTPSLPARKKPRVETVDEGSLIRLKSVKKMREAPKATPEKKVSLLFGYERTKILMLERHKLLQTEIGITKKDLWNRVAQTLSSGSEQSVTPDQCSMRFRNISKIYRDTTVSDRELRDMSFEEFDDWYTRKERKRRGIAQDAGHRRKQYLGEGQSDGSLIRLKSAQEMRELYSEEAPEATQETRRYGRSPSFGYEMTRCLMLERHKLLQAEKEMMKYTLWYRVAQAVSSVSEQAVTPSQCSQRFRNLCKLYRDANGLDSGLKDVSFEEFDDWYTRREMKKRGIAQDGTQGRKRKLGGGQSDGSNSRGLTIDSLVGCAKIQADA